MVDWKKVREELASLNIAKLKELAPLMTYQ